MKETNARSVLAIDPGYDRVGLAVFSGDKKLIVSECFTPTSTLFAERLVEVKQKIEQVIQAHRPSAVALETLFFSTNQKTALKVAEARGVITVTAAECGIPLFEYSPQAVKIAVTGSGNADKRSVIKMVERLVSLPSKKRQDDEFDAIALGIAHQASLKF